MTIIATARFDAALAEIHGTLTRDGAALLDVSESGSRYYERPNGAIVRVSDHAPNAKTRAWLEGRGKWSQAGVESIRIDLIASGLSGHERLAPDFGERLNVEIPSVECPEPGFYDDVPDDEYRRWPAAAQSILKVLAMKSASHAKWDLDNPDEPTPSMRLGTACHFATLQPDLFPDRYVVAEQCCAVTSKSDRCGNPGIVRIEGRWFCGVHRKKIAGHPDPIEIISADHFARAQATAAAVRAHPKAGPLLRSAEHIELSAVWQDEATGLACKLRADIVGVIRGPRGQERAFAMDLKTCTEADPNSFERSIFHMGYFLQAAHYMHGLAAVGLPVEDFIFCAVEVEPPHGVKVYRITDDVIRTGWELLAGREGDDKPGAYARYAECLKTGVWPSYAPEIEDIGLPEFAFRQLFRGDN